MGDDTVRYGDFDENKPKMRFIWLVMVLLVVIIVIGVIFGGRFLMKNPKFAPSIAPNQTEDKADTALEENGSGIQELENETEKGNVTTSLNESDTETRASPTSMGGTDESETGENLIEEKTPVQTIEGEARQSINCSAIDCFYVSVYGSGAHNGSLGNEFTLTEAQEYTFLNPDEEIHFSLAGGNYGTFSESKKSRTNWVIYMAENGEEVYFDKIYLMSYDPDPQVNYPEYLQFEGIKIQNPVDDETAVVLHTVNKIRLYDLEIIGDGYNYSVANPESGNSKAVYIFKSYDIEMDNTHIYGTGPSYADVWPEIHPKDPQTDADASKHGQGWNYGVYAYPAYGKITITNSLIEQCDYGIYLDGYNNTIRNNELRYLTTDGISIAGKKYDENQITVIEGNLIHDIYSFYNDSTNETDLGSHNDGIQFYGTTPEWTSYSNMYVANNTIYDIEHQGLFFNTGNGSENWTIENNLVYDVPANPDGLSVGVWIYSAKDIKFNSNTVIGKTFFMNGNGAMEISEMKGNIFYMLDLGTEKGVSVSNEDNNLMNIRWIDMEDHVLGSNSVVLGNVSDFENLFVDFGNKDFYPRADHYACNGSVGSAGFAVGALPCSR